MKWVPRPITHARRQEGGRHRFQPGSKAIHHRRRRRGARPVKPECALGNNVRDREIPPAYLLTALLLFFFLLLLLLLHHLIYVSFHGHQYILAS